MKNTFKFIRRINTPEIVALSVSPKAFTKVVFPAPVTLLTPIMDDT
jgi:hypothetical protein